MNKRNVLSALAVVIMMSGQLHGAKGPEEKLSKEEIIAQVKAEKQRKLDQIERGYEEELKEFKNYMDLVSKIPFIFYVLSEKFFQVSYPEKVIMEASLIESDPKLEAKAEKLVEKIKQKKAYKRLVTSRNGQSIQALDRRLIHQNLSNNLQNIARLQVGLLMGYCQCLDDESNSIDECKKVVSLAIPKIVDEEFINSVFPATMGCIMELKKREIQEDSE